MQFLNRWTIDVEKIPEYQSFRNKFTVKVDRQLLQLLRDVPELQPMLQTPDPKYTDITQLNMINNVIDHTSQVTNKIKLQHFQKYKVGRFYGYILPDSNTSITPVVMSRHLKHTLFAYMNMLDLDMVKGHMTIIYQVALKNSLTLGTFYNVITNFETIATEISKFYTFDEEFPITQEEIKLLFNATIYGGNLNTWFSSLEKEGIIVSNREPHPTYTSFLSECNVIISLVFANNNALTTLIKKPQVDESEFKLKNRTMSYWCQIIENEILHIATIQLEGAKVLVKNTYLLEYDGICLPQPPSNIDLSRQLAILNSVIRGQLSWKYYLNGKVIIRNIFITMS